jgi:hypothetical protein
MDLGIPARIAFSQLRGFTACEKTQKVVIPNPLLRVRNFSFC